MRRHPAMLAAAGVTPARYAELRAVCRQYQEYRRKAARQRAGLVDRSNVSSAGPWHRPDPTGEAAVSLAGYLAERRVNMIEESVREVAEEALERALLLSVTESVPYDVLHPPCGCRQFYALRLRFFIALDRHMWREQ